MRDKSLSLRAVAIFIIALALAQSLTIYAAPWHYWRNLILSNDAQPASPSKPLLQPVPPPIINPITPTIPTGPSTPVGPQKPTGPSSPTSPNPTPQPGQKPAQPGNQPSQLPKPTQPGQQPSQLPTPTNPSTLPPSPVNPVPREVTVEGIRYVMKLDHDNADLLKKVLARRGINIESLERGTQKLKIDNPDEEVEKVEQKLRKAGLYDKLDKVLRELYHTTLEEVLEGAKKGRIHDGHIGSIRVELKAAFDLAKNFPQAVKQIIQDGILQEQGKAVVKWFINTGARNMLYDAARAKFDIARSLIIELARLLGVPVEETSEAEVLTGLIAIIPKDMLSNLPRDRSTTISVEGLTLEITPVAKFKTVGKPAACLNFGERVYCFDQNGNEVNPAKVVFQ